MIHITASGATTVSTSSPRGLRINFNLAFTGTVTITDGTGVVSIVTASATVPPAWVGYGFQGTVTVNPSTTVDLGVSILNNKG